MFSFYRLISKVFLPLFAALGLPAHACRFEPTCSHYCETAIHRFGVVKGLNLCLRRIIRCRPGTPAGLDPVPNE